MMDYEVSSRASGPPDLLFLERLDTFMERNLADIKAFAEREFRPFEETRRFVAEWHARYLFQPTFQDATLQDRGVKVRTVLCDVSRMLETLLEVAGIQSFILAVDPISPSDKGFLGGTVVGREFWRGMRNGGDAGAKAFRAHCFRDLESYLPPVPPDDTSLPLPNVVPPQPKLPPARSLKTELYDGVRKALRTVSGVRNAEMKWTNHERLDVYGVRLVGWPPDIPVANPSSLKVFQNRIILDHLENGTLRFERLFPDAPPPAEPSNDVPPTVDDVPIVQQSEDTDDFPWLDSTPSDPAAAENVPQPVVSQREETREETEDTFWQATDDTSALIGDLWTDIDIASLLQNALDGTSYSRKRPRSELEQDDILDQ